MPADSPTLAVPPEPLVVRRDGARDNARQSLTRVVAVFGPAGVALAFGLLLAREGARRAKAEGWVRHTYEVVEALDGAVARLVDAETGQRGYLLTGRDAYLEPYATAERDVEAAVARARRLTRDNPTQQRRLDTLAALARQKFAVMNESIRLRRGGGAAGAAAAARLVESDRGKRAMDAARRVVASLRAEEARLLGERSARAAARDRRTRWALGAGAVAVVVAAALARGLLARAERAERLARARLERRTADLAAANAHLEDANAQLADQHLELEIAHQQLQEQAVELEAHTEELQSTTEDLAERTEIAERARWAADAARADAEQHQRAAEQANAAKSQFLANMSHELRTPLNAIAGHVQLVEMELHGPVTSAQRDALARVGRAQRHLLGLINDVLNYARLEGGRVEYDLRPVALADVIAEVAPMIEPQLTAKGLAYAVQLPDGTHEDPLLVWADREKLGQVLLNLLSNAVKFTPAGGRVTVDVAERMGDAGGDGGTPDLVYLRVTDTGVGIPRDKLTAVFEPFVQVHSGFSRPNEGTGLGLAISRDLTRGMGGGLRVRSVEGAGSTFTVTLRRVVTAAGEPTDRRASSERRDGEERRESGQRRGADRRTPARGSGSI